MRLFINLASVILLLCSSTLAFAAFNPLSPAGRWLTIDDVTNKSKAVLEITENSNHELIGRVVKIIPHPGVDTKQLCTKCEGARRNKPIVGMIVMHGLKQSKDNKNQWIDGEILEADTGKTYSCYIELLDNGKRIQARGYIGISLLGRTQTWWRIK